MSAATDERQELWQAARDLLGAKEYDSREIRAGVLIGAAFRYGPRNKALRWLTGIPVADINRCSYYLRKAGIWQGANRVFAPWADPSTPADEAAIGLVAQIMVATGDLLSPEPDAFMLRTVGSEFGVACDVLWRDLVPRRDLPDTGQVPEWVSSGGSGDIE